MAKVHLTSCFLRTQGDHLRLNVLKRLRHCAAVDQSGRHELVELPEHADLIIFAELADATGFLQDIISRDGVYRRHRERSIVFNPRMKAPPVMPGIYGSAIRSWCHPGHCISSHYLETSLERDHIQPQPFGAATYLYSFCGSSKTWAGRAEILGLSDPSALLIDSAAGPKRSDAEYREQYLDTLARSKFVLCPRGIGPASLRLFEVLKAGRVPVVIADDWAQPPGPAWDTFSICVPESDVAKIPTILREHESRAEEMAARALATFESWFSTEASFGRIIEWAQMVQADRATPSAIRHRKKMRRAYRMYSAVERTKRVVRRIRQ